MSSRARWRISSAWFSTERTGTKRWAGRPAASQIAAASAASFLLRRTPGSSPRASYGLHMRRRDEPHRKAEILQLPPPVMRGGAGLHRNDAPRKRVEKLQKRSAIDRAGNDDEARRVDRVNAEDPLGQIEPDARDRRGIDDRLAHGRLPFRWVCDNDHLGTLDAVRGAVHPISKGSRAVRLPRELRSPQRAESAGRSNGGTEVERGKGRRGRLAVTEADLINRECEGQPQPTQMSFRAVAAVANIGAPSADRGLSRWRA